MLINLGECKDCTNVQICKFTEQYHAERNQLEAIKPEIIKVSLACPFFRSNRLDCIQWSPTPKDTRALTPEQFEEVVDRATR